MTKNAEINVQMEGDNKMVKEKQEVVHKARRQSQVNLITFDCLLFFLSLIVK